MSEQQISWPSTSRRGVEPIPKTSKNERIRRELKLTIKPAYSPRRSPVFLGPTQNYPVDRHRANDGLAVRPNTRQWRWSEGPMTLEKAQMRREYFISCLQRSGDWGNHDYITLHRAGACMCSEPSTGSERSVSTHWTTSSILSNMESGPVATAGYTAGARTGWAYARTESPLSYWGDIADARPRQHRYGQYTFLQYHWDSMVTWVGVLLVGILLAATLLLSM